MAFIRTKKIKGRLYAYKVENQKINGQVRQKVLAYLGAVSPEKDYSMPLLDEQINNTYTQKELNQLIKKKRLKVLKKNPTIEKVFVAEIEQIGFKKTKKKPYLYYRYNKEEDRTEFVNVKHLLVYAYRKNERLPCYIPLNEGLLCTSSLRKLFKYRAKPTIKQFTSALLSETGKYLFASALKSLVGQQGYRDLMRINKDVRQIVKQLKKVRKQKQSSVFKIKALKEKKKKVSKTIKQIKTKIKQAKTPKPQRQRKLKAYRKPSKRKKLTGLEISNLKKLSKKYGVDEQTFDFKAHIDKKLTYYENKAIIEEKLKSTGSKSYIDIQLKELSKYSSEYDLIKEHLEEEKRINKRYEEQQKKNLNKLKEHSNKGSREATRRFDEWSDIL